MQKYLFWFISSLIFILSFTPNTFALDVIGTGRNQTEALQNALRNLSEFVSGVQVSTRFEMNKELSDGKVKTSVSDIIKSDSDFYVENMQRFVRQASDTTVVISLTDADIRELRKKYRLWKTRPDIRGSVIVEDGRVTVSLRETAGVPVSLRSYQLKINISKTSWLCSAWKWESVNEISGVFDEPVELQDGDLYGFAVELNKKFDFCDVGKREEITIKILLEGVDSLGRKLTAEI